MTDREKLIEILKVKYDHYCDQCGVNKESHYIENLADYLIANDVVIREKGEWGKSEDDYCGLNIIQCPLCHEEWCFECDDDVEMLNYNFCPNCGSDMREGTLNG